MLQLAQLTAIFSYFLLTNSKSAISYLETSGS